MSTGLTVAVLVAFGMLTGGLAGLLGVGGGIFMVPFLVLVIGLTQHAAEATSLLVVLPTAIVASLVLRRRGIGDLGLGVRLGVLGAAGSVAGVLLALELPAATLRTIFAVFLALIGLHLVRGALHDRRRAR
jgi:hypothetical protein